MKYFAAYRFVFESPDWPKLLLIGAVCHLVPVAGPLVLMGYGYTIVEAKHRQGADAFPAFNFDRLGNYLVRGVWPFLASLIVVLPFVLLIVGGVAVMVIGGAMATRENEPPVLLIPIVIVSIVLIMATQIILQFLVWPLSLRAGLSQDLGSSLSLTFIRDFVGKVWMEMLLAVLFLWITAPFLMLAGLLVFFVGIYAAATILMFAQLHYHYQLYEIFLRRGGTPIPLKNE